ncbi:MAG TPA: ATP-dependent DNA helicase RecG [Patescibacteria group bacterium]|nr:ATP-dependent DNA helicase RecG [Patescibacteria group bacterium]
MERRLNEQPLLERSQFVKGVGPARQVLLSRLEIETVEDLLLHVPRTHYDRSDLVPIAEIDPGQQVTTIATVLAVSLRQGRRGHSILTVAVGDETGIVHLVFFNQPYLKPQFRQGRTIVASGPAALYRGQKQIVAPEYEMVSGELDESLLHTGRIVPVYPLTSGITQRMMRKIIRAALDKCAGRVPENLPRSIVQSLGLCLREDAFRQIHYPDDWDSLEGARKRLKFEEVFFLHLLLRMRRHTLRAGRPRPRVQPPHPLLERFLASLPFELTKSQQRVIGEVRRDVESTSGLGRLLQGDVGSGKTVVGLAAMMLAVGTGYQAAMMVPTEILAQQHHERICEYLHDLDVRIGLLIGSMSRSDKRRVNEQLRTGEIDLVVGTHALIQEGVEFKQLGLAVIDEQHRFGVKQRARLGAGDLLPHFLVMTATPIPRSLAQTVYGDLDLSTIDEMPKGRRMVRTEIVEAEDVDRVYEHLDALFAVGRQAFIVYPLVEESERIDLQAATNAFERLRTGVFRGRPLGLLHGRMSFEEKARAITLFRRGEIAGLVTTTVIEVGVDIPNASTLVINHPERFGMAQLHQLRGRVGRGGEEGVCYLIPGERLGRQGMARLLFFAATDDGFAIAEKDLEIRGPGEVWGFRQSGLPSFRLIHPLRDAAIIQRSFEESEALIERDPLLKKAENKLVADYFHLYYKPKMELAEIG